MPQPGKLYICFALILIAIDNSAQQVVKDSATYKWVIAGPEYQKPKSWQWLWGRNCRKEWTTPVRVPVFILDTAHGGLIPYKEGGGNETRSLRLKTSQDKEYVIRSINKKRNDVVEPVYRNTFIEDIIKDGISMSHPYGAFALPVMEQQAGIYHTHPVPVYVPQQKALDTFNNKYGNSLYLFEQKMAGNWSNARNLGNFSKFNSTEEVISKLQEDNHYRADQYLFIKSRLFDMLIADWDRHEGNWCWGEMTISGITWLVPLPHDRDQAFYTHNGKLIDIILPAAGLGFMQHFDHSVKDVTVQNMEAKHLDRFFSNAMSGSDWEYAARTLQKALTDSVIEASVRQLPPEVYAVSGKVLIEKLKSRREQLPRFAEKYYRFLAQQVEVTGTRQNEYFEVSTHPNEDVSVAAFRINSNGKKEAAPYYQRVFKPDETKEVRIFGIDGNDVYEVKNYSKNITVRIIGGPGKDTVIQSGRTIHVYDNRNNEFNTASADMHLLNDSAVHAWNYKWFRYNVKGFYPMVYYNTADRLYAGINYRYRKQAWRKDPFAFEHKVELNYSISQNAVSATWSALYPKAVGGWDFSLQAGYDAIRWANFFGMGNETQVGAEKVYFHRIRSEEWFANTGLERQFGKSSWGITANYQRVKNRHDTDRYVAKIVHPESLDVYTAHQYGGLQLRYSYVSVNDSVVPVKGITFLATGALTRNFTQEQWFQKYEARLQAFFPLTKRLSFVARLGGTTVVNDNVINSFQFYQHAVVGGARTIRGYRRERF